LVVHGVEEELSRGSRRLWLASKSRGITTLLVSKQEVS
jgi:hypothetical protein